MPPPYPDTFNPDLLSRIPLAARAVLDVGCGTGALGAAYRRLNPRARLYGIECDRAAGTLAASRLDEVAVVDAEATPLPFEAGATFDCIIYGDSLEHFREPWRVVQQQCRALNEDGVVLICVPNVEHWSFVARLLHGDWDYAPSGLFDSTHLRWFTAATLRQGLAGVGLHPCDVAPRIFDADAARGFTETLRPALTALGIDPEDYGRRAAPLQHLWRARNTPRDRMVVAATAMAPVGGVSDVRILQPLRAMATDPAVAAQLVTGDGLPAVPPGVLKVLILHRPVLAGQRGLQAVRRWLADDWLIVTEFDDHPDYFEAMRGPEQFAFSGVHAVQTSTEPLATVLRPRNPEVRVFPNAIAGLPELRNFGQPGRTTLFFGALNRGLDWAPFMPALNAAAAAAGPRLRFSVVHDQAFFDALETPHKNFHPTCDYAAYLRLLGEAEICFMPLRDTWFNRAKSDLKFIEAAACRCAALASAVVYERSIEDGRTGFLFRSHDELLARLLRLTASPDAAQALGDAARAHVSAHRMLAYQTAERIAWLRELWSRKPELTAALLARVPEAAGG